MEIQQYTQIEEVVKALQVELSPIFSEVEKLNKALTLMKENEKTNPLLALIERLTKTARRHDLDKKVKTSKRNEVRVGTNHNGLGYEDSYSSQLTDLSSTNGYYNNSQRNETMVREILFDDDATLDLTTIIKKSNQKTFLKVIKILKKHKLTKTFKDFKDENIMEIFIPIAETDKKIEVNFSKSFQMTFRLWNNDGMVTGIDINKKNGKPEIKGRKEEEETLKEFSSIFFEDLSLNDIKLCFLLAKRKESIQTNIKAKRTLLNGVMDAYRKEHKELNDLLEPFLALEKL